VAIAQPTYPTTTSGLVTHLGSYADARTAGTVTRDALSPTSTITLTSGQQLRNVTINASSLSSATLISATSATDVIVENVTITGLADTKTAMVFTGCTGVKVRECRITAGGKGITFDACDRVEASGNDITLSTLTTSGFTGHGILFYANTVDHAGAVIAGNTITGTAFAHGIYSWGSDSAVLAGSVHASDVTITGNTVTNVVGGIWCSKTRGASVTGNTVRTCTDVGIDFEGSLDCTASGNTIAEAVGGALAALYNSKRIAFTGNTVTSSRTTLMGGGNEVATSNLFGFIRDTCEDILIEGNVFRCTGASRAGEINVWKNAQTLASSRVTVRGNRFYNGCVHVLGLASGVVIDDNEFYWDFDGIANGTIDVSQSNRVNVRGNTIVFSATIATTGASNSPIYLSQANAATTPQLTEVVVERNVVRNLSSLGIYMLSKTGASPDGSTYIIRDNLVATVDHSGTTSTNKSVTNNLNPTTYAASTVTSF
jgi:parallel beta-helix repeat protein